MKGVHRNKLRRLHEKLRRIRVGLGLSQNEMLERLGFSEGLFRSNISQYELGRREPPLPLLLQYARAANVYVDVLLDDELDLPEKLPASKRSEGIKRTNPVRKRPLSGCKPLS
jgi:transcriptional regulator with XRE-family HTH domain